MEDCYEIHKKFKELSTKIGPYRAILKLADEYMVSPRYLLPLLEDKSHFLLPNTRVKTKPSEVLKEFAEKVERGEPIPGHLHTKAKNQFGSIGTVWIFLKEIYKITSKGEGIKKEFERLKRERGYHKAVLELADKYKVTPKNIIHLLEEKEIKKFTKNRKSPSEILEEFAGKVKKGGKITNELRQDLIKHFGSVNLAEEFLKEVHGRNITRSRRPLTPSGGKEPESIRKDRRKRKNGGKKKEARVSGRKEIENLIKMVLGEKGLFLFKMRDFEGLRNLLLEKGLSKEKIDKALEKLKKL